MTALTPLPKEEEHRPMTMSFFDALHKVRAGKMVARISWANKDYCLLKDGWLTIYTSKDEKFHTWIINDGDMDGQDYIVVTQPN